MNRRTEVSGTTVAGETGIVGRCHCCCSVPCGHKHRCAQGTGVTCVTSATVTRFSGSGALPQPVCGGRGGGAGGLGTGVVGIYAVTALLNFLLGLCFRNPVHGARFRHCCGFSGVVGSSAVAEMFGSL